MTGFRQKVGTDGQTDGRLGWTSMGDIIGPMGDLIGPKIGKI